MKYTLDDGVGSFHNNVDGIVYYVSYGRRLGRLWVCPRDPKTPAQRERRAAFAGAVAAWRALSEPDKAAWRAHGRRCERSGYNAFLAACLLRDTNAPAAATELSRPPAPCRPRATRRRRVKVRKAAAPRRFSFGTPSGPPRSPLVRPPGS
jgi:hypothetical protein